MDSLLDEQEAQGSLDFGMNQGGLPRWEDLLSTTETILDTELDLPESLPPIEISAETTMLTNLKMSILKSKAKLESQDPVMSHRDLEIQLNALPEGVQREAVETLALKKARNRLVQELAVDSPLPQMYEDLAKNTTSCIGEVFRPWS